MALCLLSATEVPNHQTDGSGTFFDTAQFLGLVGLVLILFFFGLIVLIRIHYRRLKASKKSDPKVARTDPWSEAGRRILPDDYQHKQGHDREP